MSFLKNLFGGGPKLPEPIRDAFHGEEAFRRDIDHLAAGKWKPAALRLKNTRNPDDRAHVTGVMVEHAGHWIEEWLAAEPARAEPLIMRGLFRIGWAWEARGSGRAEDVAEDAWPVFHERLGQAEEDLHEAARRDPRDVVPWAYLVLTGKALGVPLDELGRRWEEGRSRAPESWVLPWQMIDALSEKWSGSHDVMFGFAREVSAAAPEGSALHALIAEAHLHRWEHFTFDDPPDREGQLEYYRTPEVLEELRRAWAKGPGSPAFKPGRFAPNQRALFAFAFTLGADDASARAVFDQLNRVTSDPWRHLGEPMEVFKSARREVYK